MLCRRCRPLLVSLAAVAAGASSLSGCSGDHGAPAAGPAPAVAPANPPGERAGQQQPGIVGLSPAGVTTRVDAPADSTEEEYFQACHAAKVWMDDKPDDPATLVEPYLRSLQLPGPAGVGTWHTPWAQLTAARQAAVIVAAESAAAGGCG